jgi:hypothetical protein
VDINPYLLREARTIADQEGLGTSIQFREGTVERFLERNRRAVLTAEEYSDWQEACDTAVSDGTYFLTWPHHCAIGTKPH